MAPVSVDAACSSSNNAVVGFLTSLAPGRDQLRSGNVVEVRPPAEILATLDEDGCLEGVPFMPEMLRYVGGRYTVTARVERACDTVNPINSRRMPSTVLLEDLRCDGSAHGGCEAGCLLYWKEAWLRPVSENDSPPRSDAQNGSLAELEARVHRNTRAARSEVATPKEVYRCQATEFPKATEPLSWFEPRSFVRELACGNVGVWSWLKVSTRAFLYAIVWKLGLRPSGPVHSRSEDVDTSTTLGLKPGDRVRVKSKIEIERTLTDAKTRGLWFDREMLPYCNQTHTVKGPVTRFINEVTGEMVELKSDAVILEGVVCQGQHSVGRWFCPRAIYPWWRDCWLERVEDEPTTPS